MAISVSESTLRELKDGCEQAGLRPEVVFVLITGMSQPKARAWMLENIPQLSITCIDDLVTNYSITVPTNLITNKSKFYAVAWLLGASWGQLAHMFGVTRATVSSCARSHIDPAMRDAVNANKISNLKQIIEISELNAIREVYANLLQTHTQFMVSSNPALIAMQIKKILHDRADEFNEDTPGDPYGDAPLRRIGQ